MVTFKKIASIFASAVMLGSTLGIAAAASYPAPFVSGGAADVAIVYGSNAAVSDLSAAIDIQTNLQSKVTSTTGTSASASGEAINLATSSQKLYINSTLAAARTVVAKDHLPTLLADGQSYDAAGTKYDYTQTLSPGINARKLTFSKSSESIDPGVIIDLGYSGTTNPSYNYTLTLAKTLNVSDTTNVVGYAELKILGNTFIIGANSDSNTLYLYGSGTKSTVEEGQTSTVTVSEKDHSILLVGTSSTTTATLEVDGVSKSVTKGNSYKFADGFEIYVKDLFHATKTGTLSRIELLVGSKTLHFEDGQSVRVGADDTSILGTSAEISGTAGAGITQLMISQSAESSLGDYLKSGTSYTDRVFGNLVLENTGPNIALEDEARDTIKIDTDNAVGARVSFTTALAGTSGAYTMTYGRDPDAVADGTLSRVDFAYDNDLNMSNQEGENVRINQRLVANDEDDGRIFQVVSIQIGTSSSDKATLRDVVTNTDYDFPYVFPTNKSNLKTIGRSSYYLAANTGNADSAVWTVNLTWGSGSAAGNPGNERTLFPRVRLKSGEWLAFLTSTSVDNQTVYSLPGLYTSSDYKSGARLTWHNHTTGDGRNTTTFGNVVYNVSWTLNVTTGTLDAVALGASDCIFNTTMGPAILIEEEKTADTSNGHNICVPLTTQGTNPRMPAIGTPIFSDRIGSFVTLQSNTYKSQAVNLFGTWVERDTSTGTNYAVTVKYPDEQMYVDVFFRAKDASTTPGTGGSTGTGSVVIVKDSEVDSVSGKNLIVVGGSCVNTVARKIIDSTATSPICGADFTAKTNVGAGQYLLKAVASPYNSGKTAMLVAGYEAAQTVSAAAKLKEGHATDVGTSNIYPVTSA